MQVLKFWRFYEFFLLKIYLSTVLKKAQKSKLRFSKTKIKQVTHLISVLVVCIFQTLITLIVYNDNIIVQQSNNTNIGNGSFVYVYQLYLQPSIDRGMGLLFLSPLPLPHTLFNNNRDSTVSVHLSICL